MILNNVIFYNKNIKINLDLIPYVKTFKKIIFLFLIIEIKFIFIFLLSIFKNI